MPEVISVDGTCLNFDDDKQGCWKAPNYEAPEVSNLKALEANNIKQINLAVHHDPNFFIL